MKKFRRMWATELSSISIEAEMTIGGQKEWKRVCCPISNSVGVDYCGEWCAWFDIETSLPNEWPGKGEVVRCKGEMIGVIEEET